MQNDVIQVMVNDANDTASVVDSRPWQSATVDTLAYGTVIFLVLNIVWSIVQ